MMRVPTPPRVAARLIEHLVPPADQGELLGDLHERFMDRFDAMGPRGARIWYWRQTLSLVPRLFAKGAAAAFTQVLTTHDLRFAWRSVRRSPVSSLVAVVTLAIGIGAPSTMFAFAGAILRPLPTHDGEVVVDVGLSDRSTGRTYSLPHSTFALLRDRASGLGSGLTALGAYRSDYVAVSSSEGAPARYRAAYVSAEIFQIMDARAVAGRVFTRADAAAAGPPLAVLGEDIWEDRFDRDPSILGGTLRIDGVTHTVVGVLPADFAFPLRQELWMSFDLRPGRNNAVSMVGRVPEGALPERVEEELLALTGRSPDEPLKDLDDPMIRVREYVGAFYAGDAGIFEKIIWLSIILTIIAAANVASIMLARGASRASETSVRMAIGGSRSRVMSQLVYEAVILAACGVGLGLGLASAALTLIRSQFKVANAPFWVTVELGPSSFWFAGLLAGGAVVVAGLLLAFRASKVELFGCAQAARPWVGIVDGRISVSGDHRDRSHAVVCHALVVGPDRQRRRH